MAPLEEQSSPESESFLTRQAQTLKTLKIMHENGFIVDGFTVFRSVDEVTRGKTTQSKKNMALNQEYSLEGLKPKLGALFTNESRSQTAQKAGEQARRILQAAVDLLSNNQYPQEPQKVADITTYIQEKEREFQGAPPSAEPETHPRSPLHEKIVHPENDEVLALLSEITSLLEQANKVDEAKKLAKAAIDNGSLRYIDVYNLFGAYHIKYDGDGDLIAILQKTASSATERQTLEVPPSDNEPYGLEDTTQFLLDRCPAYLDTCEQLLQKLKQNYDEEDSSAVLAWLRAFETDIRNIDKLISQYMSETLDDPDQNLVHLNINKWQTEKQKLYERFVSLYQEFLNNIVIPHFVAGFENPQATADELEVLKRKVGDLQYFVSQTYGTYPRIEPIFEAMDKRLQPQEPEEKPAEEPPKSASNEIPSNLRAELPFANVDAVEIADSPVQNDPFKGTIQSFLAELMPISDSDMTTEAFYSTKLKIMDYPFFKVALNYYVTQVGTSDVDEWAKKFALASFKTTNFPPALWEENAKWQQRAVDFWNLLLTQRK